MHFRSILMGAAASALCASAALAERGSDGQVNILYWQAVSIMTPYLSNGTKDVEAASLVLEPLARFDEKGDMVPYLAAEIPTLENGGVSEDLTTITWKLKDGLVWSDGTPVTAEDAVFTWQYCTHPEGGCAQSPNYGDVANVEAVDSADDQGRPSACRSPIPTGRSSARSRRSSRRRSSPTASAPTPRPAPRRTPSRSAPGRSSSPTSRPTTW